MDELTLFAAALERDTPTARAAYLDGACGNNSTLRNRVEELLQAHDRGGDFMQEPVVERTLLVEPPPEPIGTRIGPYKIREQLGEGGMGVVYVAEQTVPVRRKVALKIIKPGLDSKEVIARFEAERQALAMMSHPHIAKVLDGGTTDTGRPYFVMELVNGIAITKFCDGQRLTMLERLELFATVCQAVQHAHVKGIIHRDLKPSNVLVELHDVTFVPKVIDFGIAKATNQQLTEQTVYTQFSQLIGTPLYMSPEQAQLSGLDVDTRSDVYSLGVILYELLTGTKPFDESRLRSVGWDEMRRIIREDEPPRPSHNVSTLDNKLASTISDRRQTNARSLSLSMQRELDWIVMKALEKDRTRRYESASDLAADIQRYLNDETVKACPPSVAYLARKFVRKHRTALVCSALIVLALLAGLAATTTQATRALRAEKQSKENLQLAVEKTLRMARMLYSTEMLAVTEDYLHGNLDRVRETLARYAPADAEADDLRGYEWYLFDGLHEIPQRSILQIDKIIRTAHQHTAAGLILMGDASGMVHLLDPWRGITLTQFDSGHDEVFGIAAHGARGFVTCGAEGDVALWEFADGPSGVEVSLRQRVHVSDEPLLVVTAAPDDKTMYVAGHDRRVAAIDTSSWTVRNRSGQLGHKVECLHVSPAGTLIVGAHDGMLSDLDPGTLTVLNRRAQSMPMGPFKDFAANRQHRLLACGQILGQLTLLDDVRDGGTRFTFLFPADIHSVAISGDGRWIAGGDAHGRLHLVPAHYDLDPGFMSSETARRRRMRSWTAHKGKIESIFFMVDESGREVLVSAARDGTIGVSDPFAASFHRDVFEEVLGCEFITSEMLLTAGAELAIRRLEEPLEPFWKQGSTDDWQGLQFTPATQEAYLLGRGAREILRAPLVVDQDVPQLGPLETLCQAPPGEFIANWAISPDTRRLAVVYEALSPRAHRLELLDLEQRALVRNLPSRLADDLQFSPDSTRLAIVQNNDIILRDARTGRQTGALSGHSDSIHNFAFHPRDDLFASVSNDGTVICWDLRSQSKLWQIEAHANRASAVLFHPQLPTLVTAGVDGMLRFWSTTVEDRPDSFRLVGEFPLKIGNAWRMSFSPDGRRLVIRHAHSALTLLNSSPIPSPDRPPVWAQPRQTQN